MELLNACTYCANDEEFILTALAAEIDLTVPDPKSQREIDRLSPQKHKLFNDATLNEVKGMKSNFFFENTTMDELPRNTKIYQSIVNWTSKTNLGVYVKTKCRICFGGHQYNKSYSDTFAPTVNFCTVCSAGIWEAWIIRKPI